MHQFELDRMLEEEAAYEYWAAQHALQLDEDAYQVWAYDRRCDGEDNSREAYDDYLQSLV